MSTAQHHRTAAATSGSPVVVVDRINVLLASLGMLLVACTYWLVALLPEAFALLILVSPPLMLVSRIWRGRRGEVEFRLLRHPFRRELRAYLLQCLNYWLFLALFIAILATGAFTLVPAFDGFLFKLPLPDRIPYPPLLVALGMGAVVMGALAIVPHHRVQVATNVVLAVGSVFLTIQLVRIYMPPASPVTLDLPLGGEWTVTAGGRSVFLSHHYKDAYERHGVDFVQLVNGRAFSGDPARPESWYGFGEAVLAPADGTVVSVSDLQPDEPIGAIGGPHGEGNNIVLKIDDQRYAMLSHLKRGSVRVNEGDRVQSGQPIAAVGDSGNSLGPHLHFQIQRDADFDMRQTRTLPIVFRNVDLIRSGPESRHPDADLKRGDHVRRIVS